MLCLRWPTWQYAKGRKRVREMEAKKINMFSTVGVEHWTQKVRYTTLLYTMPTYIVVKFLRPVLYVKVKKV